ncbi:MAG: protein-L-isoaspartate(D-aspartate) O-methyltransferase [Gammaproteobacteria bacterium]
MTSQRTRDRLIERLRGKGIANEQVLQVMRTTPRHLFIDEALASRAYEDTALPIGHGQTISQPYIVARMTEILLAGLNPKRVLEVGTGCGYQTAVLAPLVEQLYSVDRIAPLQTQARQRLTQLQLRNIVFRITDGHWGWSDYAPYDGILVTAAPDEIPEELLYQLADGGRLVIPIGQAGQQRLFMIRRDGEDFHHEALDWVSFVPLIRGR